ncbi:MAG: hypothetical protein SCH98_15210 [Deferrisomatales bacterium]|nr:hypothetical protein [Deferrisomatales bacterium]
MRHLAARMKSLMRADGGAALVEYAILASLISIAAVAALLLIGPKILAAFNSANTAFP